MPRTPHRSRSWPAKAAQSKAAQSKAVRRFSSIRPVALLLIVLGVSIVAPGPAVVFGEESPIEFNQISNMFEPVSKPAEKIHELAELVIAICAGIFVTVAGLLLYVILRFRARPGDARSEPPQVYGSNNLEAAWTIVPVIIVVVLFLATARTINEIELKEPMEGALEVTVVGHRWWWQFDYPEYGITTANELHIPVSTDEKPRPTFLWLESQDVVHSFWIPRLAGKTDVVPNRRNTLWIDTAQPGLYLGQCAEYCGTQHAHMLLRVYVHSEEEFAAWVEAQQAPDVVDPSVQAGRDLFQRTACINYHTLGGTVADGTYGPTLSHLMSRETIGAGAAWNTEENLRKWVQDPATFKPGVRMPDMKLSSEEVDALVAYLVTLK